MWVNGTYIRPHGTSATQKPEYLKSICKKGQLSGKWNHCMWCSGIRATRAEKLLSKADNRKTHGSVENCLMAASNC